MGTRLELQTLLSGFLPAGRQAWFQPSENTELTYPTVLYEHDYNAVVHGDNKPYSVTRRYQLTLIDRAADSAIKKQIEALPMCSMVRSFATEGLNHTIYDLYF